MTLVTLASPAIHEDEIKKSRFIARAGRADSVEEAMELVSSMGEADANHNCWAYKIGSQYRFSDDGEPGGSAGRPILAAIEGQGIDHVVVVVIRYFGGTKLGVGGLVRAYGGAAAECLRTCNRLEVVPKIGLCVSIPFDLIGAFYPLLDKLSATKEDERYTEEGVQVDLLVPASDEEELRAAVRDATRGQGKISGIDED